MIFKTSCYPPKSTSIELVRNGSITRHISSIVFGKGCGYVALVCDMIEGFEGKKSTLNRSSMCVLVYA